MEGTWGAKTHKAALKISASGTYTFRKDLGGHILARHINTYELKGAGTEGKFEMKMADETEWASYLEWSGAKK